MKVFLEEIKGLTTGRSVTLPKGTTRIGRKDSDINVQSQRVSQNHAEVHFSGTRVFVLDRNSTNGTFVNNNKVERMSLRDGDIISIGGINEDAAAEFKVHIIRMFSRKRVIIIVKEAGQAPKILLVLFILFLLLFVLWLFLPQSENGHFSDNLSIMKDTSKPWVGAEPLISSPLLGGTKLVIALGDEILLPEGLKWETFVNYDNSKGSDPFDDLMYITVVNPVDDTEMQDERDKVISTFTVQKFKGNFGSDIEPFVVNNFKWHETQFLKENNITDQKFNYSMTDLCIWQWLVWEKETKFNLYASCITRRGRILIQASSFDPYTIKRFFQYVAGSYKEGRE